MRFAEIEASQWKEVKSIYMEAFPKRERKPLFVLKHSVKRGKARVFTASDENGLLGFTVAIPYQNMVMVDYLAVSGKIRSKGTGSFIMQEICQYFSDKKVVLLIEQLDEGAENQEQRIARRRFYLKNGFTSADIFVEGAGGDMEILNFGGKVSPEDYMRLQKCALGRFLFSLSGMRIVEPARA